MRVRNFFLFTVLFFTLPAFAHATVVINEIAWMGTAANSNAEWIELSNSESNPVDLSGWKLTSSSWSSAVTLTGTISGNGYYLLEHNTTGVKIDIAPDQPPYTGTLPNSGATLTLTDGNGTQIDQVVGGTNWVNIGGNTTHYDTAQRTASGWETATPTPRAINFGISASTPPDTSSEATSTTEVTTTSSSSGGPAEYLPIPALRIVTGGDRTVSSGADTAFTATVYDGKGNKRDDALVTWSFGDGMRRTGASVFHEYYGSGEYLAIVRATTSDGGDALTEIIMTVKDASIKITLVSSRGITLANNDSRTLDLSLWRLSMGGQEFKIPENTQILAGRTILFPSQVIELPVADSVSLLYPSGEVADAYPPAAVSQVGSSVQPSPGVVGYEVVQAVEPLAANKVEPIIGTAANIRDNEEAVNAPAAATELAAAGAVAQNSFFSNIFHSPWTLGFLSIVALAGGAFIFI